MRRYLAIVLFTGAAVLLAPMTAAAAMAEIGSFEFGGFGADVLGPGENPAPDGAEDPFFTVTLSGVGGVTGFVLSSADGKSSWDTVAGNSVPGMRVTDRSDNIVVHSGGSMPMVPFLLEAAYTITVPDDGSIARGGKFILAARFADGSQAQSAIEIPPTARKLPSAPEKEKAPEASDTALSGLAVMAGQGDRDLVGGNEKRQGNGKPDWRIDLRVENQGTITGIRVFNSAGPAGEWDTTPGNGRWLVAVAGADGKVLNSADGKVRIPVSEPLSLALWLENNGSLDDSTARTTVTLYFDDGRELSTEVKAPAKEEPPTHRPRPYRPDRPDKPDSRRDAEKREVFFSNPRRASSSDYVGPRKKPGKSGEKDWLFEFRIDGKGIVEGIKVESLDGVFTWDTSTRSRNWLAGVLVPGKKELLNRSDGSVSFEVPPHENLQIFVEDNGILNNGSSHFKITVTWSDGSETTASN